MKNYLTFYAYRTIYGSGREFNGRSLVKQILAVHGYILLKQIHVNQTLCGCYRKPDAVHYN